VHCCQLQAAAAAGISNKCCWTTSVRGGGGGVGEGDLNGWCIVADQKCPFFVFANFVKYEIFTFGENLLQFYVLRKILGPKFKSNFNWQNITIYIYVCIYDSTSTSIT
jgi:hypothetical protein